jgi:DNA primase small subunit
MEDEWGSPEFVQQQFKVWYAQNSHTIKAPLNVTQREFAFLTFFGRTMYRHIQFLTQDELQRYLRQNAPAHSYYSSSYYERPTADMSVKGWLGADLVFDLDADHFDLQCQKSHDKWKCRNCGKEGKGHPPEKCECGKAQFITDTWLCEKCLQAAKHETQKLIDILVQDFGVSPNELMTNFSGNRGYHVHVHSDLFKSLDQYARREIVDYIMGNGLDLEFQGFNSRGGGVISTLAEGSWRGRTARALYDYILETPTEELKSLKLSPRASRSLQNNKDELLKTLTEKHPSNLLSYIDLNSLKKIVDKAISLQASEIDTVVTTDIHRLIRLTNTLHGKTGWEVQTIPYGGLMDYEPMRNAVVVRGPYVKLEFRGAPKIKINDTWYGPYGHEEAELPLEAALFFLCKKGARVHE